LTNKSEIPAKIGIYNADYRQEKGCVEMRREEGKVSVGAMKDQERFARLALEKDQGTRVDLL
jgi:hypothetical protein